jgi:16S rRNA (cytidine1402-2'-O)-methyltransferase
MSKLYVIATPIGNIQDFSPRAIQYLQSSDLILAEDTRHSKILLGQFSISAPILSYYKFNETKRTKEIIDKMLSENLKVSLICDAGTPCISDPGYIIVKEARKHNIPIFGVSGPSAVITALSVSGLPADSFTFHGFPPSHSEKQLRSFFHTLKTSGINTHVLYEAPHRIRFLAHVLSEELPNAEVCFCAELTKIHERSYYGLINEVCQQLESDSYADKGEYTVVIHLNNQEDEKRIENTGQSWEARLVDLMISEKISLKEAADKVSKTYKIPKKQVYQASLNLKSLWQKDQ